MRRSRSSCSISHPLLSTQQSYTVGTVLLVKLTPAPPSTKPPIGNSHSTPVVRLVELVEVEDEERPVLVEHVARDAGVLALRHEAADREVDGLLLRQRRRRGREHQRTRRAHSSRCAYA